MKKLLTKFAAMFLVAVSLLSFYPGAVQAAPSRVSTDSSYTATFTVTTKSKWTEFAKSYPAKLTFTQTKGDYTFTNEYGVVTKKVKNVNCWYDIDYTIYLDNKYYGRGHIDFCKEKETMYLKASSRKTFKYVFTIKPHYARVRNNRTGNYYLGYKWTRPSSCVIDPTHDIVSLYRNKQTKNK